MKIIKRRSMSPVFLSVYAAMSLLLVATPMFVGGISHSASALTQDKIIFRNQYGYFGTINPDGTNATVLGLGDHARISPDGNKISYNATSTVNPPYGFDVYTVNSDDTNTVNVTGGLLTRSSAAEWSPDGTKLLVQATRGSDNGLFTINADGSNLQYVVPGARQGSWSPDGTKIVFDCEGFTSKICVANADGSNLVQLTDNNYYGSEPTWSPDGGRIAWVGGRINSQRSSIMTMRPDGTDLVDVTGTPSGGDITDPNWSPDSTKIIFSSYLGPDAGAPYTYRLFTVSSTGGTTSEIYREDGAVSSPQWHSINNQRADTVAPTFGTPTWSKNPKAVSATSILSVPVSDPNPGTGVKRGEYFIGDTDPGIANATAMTISNGVLSTTIGTDLTPGIYKVSVRAMDYAGNWSSVVTDYLVVYNPAGPGVTGNRSVTPSLGNGDVMPGLTSSTQTDRATFSFNAKYTSGVIDSASKLQLTYNTGGVLCPIIHTSNCHNFSLNSTGIAWLVVQGSNNSSATVQGTASMVIDGVTTQPMFRLTAIDGTRLTPASADRFQILIYAPGANPNTASSIYRINTANITQGNITIQ